MSNVNSFAENMRRVVELHNEQLGALAAMQRSMVDNDMFTVFNATDSKGNKGTYQIPTYTSMANDVKAIKASIESLNNGSGSVYLQDGTKRQVKLESVAAAPRKIVNIENPSTFYMDPNWFFENFMYPAAYVYINLSGQVEDDADRCRVKRIIIDSTNAAAMNFWENQLRDNDYTYTQLVSLLSINNIPYYEDDEDCEFPVNHANYYGEFIIQNDPEIIDGNVWYTVDTLNYQEVTDEGVTNIIAGTLSDGVMLRYNNTIFSIIEVKQAERKIRIKNISGIDTPGYNSVLNLYEDPLKEKLLKVHFGANEYNIIYFKAIQEKFNLMSSEWSTPVKFFSNDLILGNGGNGSTSFLQFYVNNVVDWGANMIAEAKEKNIKAYYGKTPNAPSLNAGDFKVVQINTQINAALDNSDMKSTTANIESVKSEISSLKSTIAAQKTDLQSITNLSEYDSLQKQITSNNNRLNSLQTQYTSLVSYLQQLIKENGAVSTDPKYHIRGFFPIPEPQYSDDEQTVAQEVIGFEIAYRYIKTDNSGVALNTYEYTGNDGNAKMSGIFSDWNIVSTVVKERVYDDNSGTYVWAAENPEDSTQININQVDIPITNGEKVEFKIRSISEAGWPNNSLKSEWSNSVIVEFPSTLASENELASLIKDSNDEALDIAIESKMSAFGIDTHLNDTVPNTNSVNGIYFKHVAENIAYEKKNSTLNTIETESVQDIIDYLIDKVSDSGSDNDAMQVEIDALKTKTNILDLVDVKSMFMNMNDLSYGLSQITSAFGSVDTLGAEMSTLKITTENLKNSIQDFKYNDYTVWQTSVNSFMDNLKTNTAEGNSATALEKANEALTKVNVMLTDVATAKSDAANANSNVQTLTSKISVTESNMNNVQSQISTLQSDVNTLKMSSGSTDIAVLKSQVNTLSTTVNSHDSTISSYNSKINDAVNTANSAYNTANTANNKISSISSQLDSIQNTFNSIDADALANLPQELESMRSLQSNLSTAYNEVLDVIGDLNDLSTYTHKDISTCVDDLYAKLDDCSTKCNANIASIDILKTYDTSIQNYITVLNSSVNTAVFGLNSSIYETAANLHILSNQVTNLNTLVNSLSGVDMTNDISVLSAKVDLLSSYFGSDSFTERLASAEATISSLLTSIASLNAQMAAINGALGISGS